MMHRTITLAILYLNIFASLTTGLQFITGPCNKDSDCQSSCCGFNSGKCAGPVIAQTRDGGCGHGEPQPNNRAAVAFSQGMAAQNSATAASTFVTAAAAPPASATTATGSSGSGKAPGTQFITSPCGSDADCNSGGCGFRSGKCAGPVIAQERDGGCGFGNASPNADAARKLGFTGPVGGG